MTNGNKQEDIRLVKGCVRKDAYCQKKLFELYYARMLSICLRYARNREDAKDLLQEGFIKVFNNIESFDFQGSLIGWMKKIMVNNAIDKYRQQHKEPFMVDINDVYDVGIPEEVHQQMNRDALLKMIQELPHGYRTVFNLYVIEGYSHKEIGKKIGISEGTSKSQLAKARNLLKKKLQGSITVKDE